MTHQLPDGTGGEVPKAGPLDSQPVIVTNAITGVILALLALAREFGVPLTQGQHVAIMAAVGAVFLLIGTVLTWRRVTPLVDPTDNQGRALVPEDPPTGRPLR